MPQSIEELIEVYMQTEEYDLLVARDPIFAEVLCPYLALQEVSTNQLIGLDQSLMAVAEIVEIIGSLSNIPTAALSQQRLKNFEKLNRRYPQRAKLKLPQKIPFILFSFEGELLDFDGQKLTSLAIAHYHPKSNVNPYPIYDNLDTNLDSIKTTSHRIVFCWVFTTIFIFL